MHDSTTSPDRGALSTPASPCIGVCRLDARHICLGCGRHIVAIAAAGVEAERARAHASGKLQIAET